MSVPRRRFLADAGAAALAFSIVRPELVRGSTANTKVDLEQFTDLIGRRFRQPKEGLGFDGSPVAHMWRSIIRPDAPL